VAVLAGTMGTASRTFLRGGYNVICAMCRRAFCSADGDDWQNLERGEKETDGGGKAAGWALKPVTDFAAWRWRFCGGAVPES